MTTLTLDPLASLLARLFDEADASSPATAGLRQPVARRASAADAQQDRLHRLVCAPEGLSARGVARDRHAAVHARAQRRRAVGRRIRHVVRHFDAAPRALRNGGGRLVTSEFEPSKVVRWANLAAAGLADLVEIREGDALRTLAADLPDSVDLLLLDGAKALYPEVLALVEQRLRPGAFVVADNADFSPDYRLRARRRTAICRCRSATMSSCRCGSAELCGI